MPEPTPVCPVWKSAGFPCLGDCLVERIREHGRWEEALHGRVELEALDAELGDEPSRLARADLALRGSIEANGIRMSLFSAASCATSSFP